MRVVHTENAAHTTCVYAIAIGWPMIVLKVLLASFLIYYLLNLNYVRVSSVISRNMSVWHSTH
jgi:hypothetical protein